jgi:hypothetical protein
MNATQVLQAARAAGIKLGIDGDALTLEAQRRRLAPWSSNWRATR